MKPPYDDPFWTRIHPLDRAQLLLVIEDLKPGTIINGDHFTLPRIAHEYGLEAHLTVPPSSRHPVWLVAQPEPFIMSVREEIGTVPSGTRRDAERNWHRFGILLGYPECCIAEYSRERHEWEKPPLHYQFARDIARYEQEGRSIPEAIDHRPPAFTPCSIECPQALETLTRWMEAMRTYDPEAAEALVSFNRNGFYRDEDPLIIT